MKRVMGKLEYLLSLGGIKKDIVLLVISGIAVVCSLLKFQPFPIDMAWFAIILCGLPIILALLYCLYKNGTLSAILTPSCGCGCGCTGCPHSGKCDGKKEGKKK